MLNSKVTLGSLFAATAIGAMALFFSVSSASALCKGPTNNCGVPPKPKCHTVNVTCPGGHHPTSCSPHTVTVCN